VTALNKIASCHGYGCDNIMAPKSIAIMALRLGAETNIGLWDVKDILHGALSDAAWSFMWQAMQAITVVEGDYYARMGLAADYLETLGEA
jgi:hypothetical protein